MATRIYVDSTTQDATDIAPAFGAWTSTTGAHRHKGRTPKGATARLEQALQNVTSGANNRTAAAQIIIGPMAAQTLSGTITITLEAREGAGTDNINQRSFSVRVCDATGTVRNTPRALATSGGPGEIANAAFPSRGVLVANAVALTSQSVLAGDYIVVEVGLGMTSTGTTPQFQVAWDETGADHLAADLDTTGPCAWVEFSANLVFAATASSVTLTPAVLTLAAPPVTPVPGPVTVALPPATLTLSAPPLTPGLPPAAVALTPAVLALAAQPLAPIPQPVTVPLTPATVGLAAQPVTPTPGPVAVALTPAVASLAAVPANPLPVPVAVALTPAVVSLAAVPLQLPVTGPSSVTLTPATLTLAAPPLSPAPAPGAVTLTPAALTLAAAPLAATPQPVAVALTPATLTLAAVPLTPALASLTAARGNITVRDRSTIRLAGGSTIGTRDRSTVRVPTRPPIRVVDRSEVRTR